MIETAEQIIIIYTDYFTAVFIVHQLSLNIVDIEKLNLHLIYVSEYLQCFCLNIHYKSEKTNIVFNALSQLASHEYQLESDEFSLNVLHLFSVSIYANIFIKMLSEFHQHIFDRYIKKSC